MSTPKSRRRKKGEMSVVIKVPVKAWDLLFETLTLDSKSSIFDPKLRLEIRGALEQVRTVYRGWMTPKSVISVDIPIDTRKAKDETKTGG